MSFPNFWIAKLGRVGSALERMLAYLLDRPTIHRGVLEDMNEMPFSFFGFIN